MLNTMIQAYALGCLSIDEIRQLRKSIENNPEFNVKDLGKYQNLAALFPSTLTAEIPDQRIKEKIARKLYRIKNETGIKVVQTSEKTNEPYQSKDISKEIIHRSTGGDTGSEKYQRITGQTKQPVAGETKRSKDFGDIKLTSTHVMRPVKRSILFISVGIALVIGILAGFLIFYERTDLYTEEINKLNNEVQALNTELVVHSGLLNLLEKKDTRVYPLTGSDIHPDGFGKIYLNNSSNRAYLYLSGVPAAPEKTKYQLWIIKSDTIYPIGLFNPLNGSGYFYFTFPRIESGLNIRFLLTEEPEAGSNRPGKKVYLTSSN